MANINSIDINNDKIIVNLNITKKEYGMLKQKTDNLLLMPVDDNTLNKKLTTGKLGNSNRIMLPKRVLADINMPELKKKVNSALFEVNDDIFLLIKLTDSKISIPVFGDEE